MSPLYQRVGKPNHSKALRNQTARDIITSGQTRQSQDNHIHTFGPKSPLMNIKYTPAQEQKEWPAKYKEEKRNSFKIQKGNHPILSDTLRILDLLVHMHIHIHT